MDSYCIFAYYHYLFYYHYFNVQMIPKLAKGSSFKVAPIILWHVPIIP